MCLSPSVDHCLPITRNDSIKFIALQIKFLLEYDGTVLRHSYTNDNSNRSLGISDIHVSNPARLCSVTPILCPISHEKREQTLAAS